MAFDEQQNSIAVGYVGGCGERVIVYCLQSGASNTVLPQNVTVTCRNAHVATFPLEHIAFLEYWTEEAA
jgi:hypothetical protein